MYSISLEIQRNRQQKVMNSQPKFTIVIPVKEVNDYVRETVPYIQNLELNDWELFIVPNDNDQNEWLDDERISLISSGRVGPADKRDQASKIANGEFLVFLDDDSYPNSDLLSVASTYFSDESVSAIGGPAITPESDSFWQKVSGAVFLSRLTGGNPERYIPVGVAKEIDDWPSVNFIIRKTDYLEIGGFDSPYWPGEDTYLCLKLTKASKKMIYVPNLIVFHHRRSGFLRHMKQVGAYGLHRGYFARRYPDTSFRFKYLVPSFTLVAVCAIILTPITPKVADQLLFLGVVIYGVGVMAGCIDVAIKCSTIVALCSVPFVIGTHMTYGFFFLKGFVRRKPLISKLR